MKQLRLHNNLRKYVRTSLSAFILLVGVLIAYSSGGNILDASSSAELIKTTPTGFVTDNANLLSSEQKTFLETAIQAHKEKTGGANGGDEIAVVTIKTLDGDTLENFANNLFNGWGIGDAKKNNGVLLLVALDEKKIRIEVGYGLEDTLTDFQTFKISDGIMKPLFREGKYGEGIIEGTTALIQTIQGDGANTDVVGSDSSTYDVPANEFEFKELDVLSEANSFDTKKFIIEFVTIVLLVVITIILFPYILYRFGKTPSWWMGGIVGAVITIIVSLILNKSFPSLISLIKFIIFGLVIDYVFSKTYRKGDEKLTFKEWSKKYQSSGGSGGGFSSGSSSSTSSSSGSSSSFSGGSSGGGGSSSSW